MPTASLPRTRRTRIRTTRILTLLVLLNASAGVTVPGAGAATDPIGVWPLRPVPAIVARFDPPASPYAAGHRGVDLLGSPGQSVHAALPGTVSFAGSLGGRGVLVVNHGATRTTYEPVASSVAVGAVVAAGAVIGTLQGGLSHCPPRTCLHWGWIAQETYLDPLRLVGVGPVRLLPSGPVTPRLAAPTPMQVEATWAPPPRMIPAQALGWA